jgi:predicted ATPase
MKTIYSIYKSFLNNINEKSYRIFDAINKDSTDVFKHCEVNINKNSNILIIYGENCTGKSLFANILETIAQDKEAVVRSASMKNRTRAGVQRAIVLGDESRQSTGETSASFSLKSLKTTLKEKNLAISILDEPDIGLSDYYSGAFGQLIAEISNQYNQKQGLVLISHSKQLMKYFLENNTQKISTFGVNTDLSFEDWIKREDIATIDELNNLVKMGHEKELAISKAIK